MMKFKCFILSSAKLNWQIIDAVGEKAWLPCRGQCSLHIQAADMLPTKNEILSVDDSHA
jgi:hypothetical protein